MGLLSSLNPYGVVGGAFAILGVYGVIRIASGKARDAAGRAWAAVLRVIGEWDYNRRRMKLIKWAKKHGVTLTKSELDSINTWVCGPKDSSDSPESKSDDGGRRKSVRRGKRQDRQKGGQREIEDIDENRG
ncbi:MAG: hypothetical protein LBM23_03065 [Propionibacteriaceae bacterium]|jgi:hypothetical protein|nr:hypothetical protein [Propionibacteriaceae bacterium]